MEFWNYVWSDQMKQLDMQTEECQRETTWESSNSISPCERVHGEAGRETKCKDLDRRNFESWEDDIASAYQCWSPNTRSGQDTRRTQNTHTSTSTKIRETTATIRTNVGKPALHRTNGNTRRSRQTMRTKETNMTNKKKKKQRRGKTTRTTKTKTKRNVNKKTQYRK